MFQISLVFRFAIGLTLLSWMSIAFAQEINAENVVKKTQRIQFTDANAKPIEGVTVKPFGLNTSYFWPEKLMGQPNEHVSDADGFVTLNYPERFADSVMCKSIDFVTQHAKYVGTVERLGIVAPEVATVVLKKGIKMRVAAVDEDGKPVMDKYAAMVSSESAPENWQRLDDGSIVTESIGAGNFQVMLVQPMENGKTRFSEPLFYHFDESNMDDGVDIDDIELVEGVRVFGAFPSHIPRPIQNGLVMAVQFPMPIAEANKAKINLLSWADWVEVNADGNFEFNSMPRSGQIQIIALCDGWVSPGKSIFTEGQQFQLHDDDRQVDLEFVRTVQAIFTVRDEKGQPIPDASIGCNPNQLWKDWGSQILGDRAKSIYGVNAMLGAPPNKPLHEPGYKNFTSTTDKEGVAKILNLPIYFAGQAVSIGKKGYKEIQKEVQAKDIVDNGSPDEQPSVEYEVVLEEADAE